MKAFSTAISASFVAISFFSSVDRVGTKDRFIKDICSKNSTVTATKKIFVCKVFNYPCCFDRVWILCVKKRRITGIE